MIDHTTARLLAGSLATLAACSNETAAGPGSLATCSVAAATLESLAPGAYGSTDPASDSGCVRFPANASAENDSAEYVVIAQSVGGAPGDSAPFELRSATLATAVAPRLTAQRRALRGDRGSISRAFDRFLRGLERLPQPARAAPATRLLGALAPPTPGSLRAFPVSPTSTAGYSTR